MSRAVLAGLAYFAVVFSTGFLLGTLRVFLLVPWFGEVAAVLIELPLILGIAWFACRRLIAAFDVSSALVARLTMGGMAFLMLMSAELGLSVLAFGRTLGDLLAQYYEIHVLLGVAGQVAFGTFPTLQRRR